MGNCIQKNKLKIVEGISVISECREINECEVNKCHEVKRYPNFPSEDTEGNYIWLSLYTSSSNLQREQEEGFVISSHNSSVNPTNYGINVWLRKKRNDIRVD